jgi:quercetin dioxygenase-like cupin family protein
LSVTRQGILPGVEHWNLTEIDTPHGTRDPIVLRQDDGGRAILISLHPGQELGDHQVKEDMWLTVVEGSVRIRAGDEAVEAGVGSLFRFDHDERHSVASEGGARVLLFLALFPGPGHYRGGDVAQ